MPKEYIDREAYDEALLAARANYNAYDSCESKVIGGILKAQDLLDEMPAADVVEVVRCADCIHRGHGNECPMFHLIWQVEGGYGWTDITMDEFYCSFGERKDGADNAAD